MIQREFQIQPETNNSVTLWIRGHPINVIADHKNLVIIFHTDNWKAELSENGVRINRIPVRKAPTIEEISGSIDYGGVPPAGDVTHSAPLGRRSFLLCPPPLHNFLEIARGENKSYRHLNSY